VAAPNVPATTTPVVYFAHNVEHQIWHRLASVTRQPMRRAALELEWRRVRRCEARMVRQSALTIAVSDADRADLAALAPAARVGVVPTGVDVDAFVPARGGEVPGRIVFCGSMDWYPNEDAVLDFAEHVWPGVRAAVPHATFQIVGRRPAERIRRLAGRNGIDVTGTVPDVRSFVAAADVCVVPLRVGGGTRIKIFEALAMGKAVVSTTIGAEGLGLVDGTEAVLADGHEALNAALIRLCRDPGERARLGAAGRARVASRHTWHAVAAEFSRLLHHAVNGPAPPAQPARPASASALRRVS
jgi:glycosyltransferase involved in cell wall biosynthesis